MVKRQPSIRKPVTCGQPLAGAEASNLLAQKEGRWPRAPLHWRRAKGCLPCPFPGELCPISCSREHHGAAVEEATHLGQTSKHHETARAVPRGLAVSFSSALCSLVLHASYLAPQKAPLNCYRVTANVTLLRKRLEQSMEVMKHLWNFTYHVPLKGY